MTSQNEINRATDRIFNRVIDALCAVKGLEFLTTAEYIKVQSKMKQEISKELLGFKDRVESQ